MRIADLVARAQKAFPRLYSAGFGPSGWAWLPPLHVYFEVTYRCNLRCTMCHFLRIIEDTEKGKLYRNELPAETVKKTLARLPRFAVVTFTGGEALLKDDFMEILEYAVTRQAVHLISNGTALDSPLAERLVELRSTALWKPGLFSVGVSMTGTEPAHSAIAGAEGAVRKTRDGLQRLLAARGRNRYPMVHLTCVILPQNAADLPSLYAMADGLGVDWVNFVVHNPAEYVHHRGFDQESRLGHKPPPVAEIDAEFLRTQLSRLRKLAKNGSARLRFSPNGITPEEIVRYYGNRSEHSHYRCRAPWGIAGISAYGDVWSCPHVPTAQVGPDGAFAWNSAAFRRFRVRIRQEKIFPGCLGCCQSEYVGPAI
jgi:MoaA/NifB/PqqE/SkfB family radical SAM enzyme